MNLRNLTQLLKTAALSGAEAALAQAGTQKDGLSPAAAYRVYGRSQVERWQREGLIAPGPSPENPLRKAFDRRALEAIAATSNRHTYLPVANR